MERLYLACAAEDWIERYDQNLQAVGKIRLHAGEPLGPKRLARLGDCLYTANAYHGSVTRINLKSGEQLIKKLCPYPTDILALPEQGLLALSCGETDKLLFLDPSLHVADAVAAKSFPLQLSYLPNQQIAVTCLYHRKIRLYGAQDHHLKRVLDVPGYPNAACALADGLLVAASEDGYLTRGKLYAFDAQKRLKATLDTGMMPSAVYTDGRYIFVANTGNRSVDWVDTRTHQKKSVPVPEMPDHIVRFGEYVCVSCIIDQTLVAMDLNADIRYTIRTGADPRGMCVA